MKTLELENNLVTDTGLSFGAHAAVVGLLYLSLFHHSQTVLANLDLSLPALQVSQMAAAQKADDWILPNKKNRHSAKKAAVEKAEPEQANSWVPAAQTARQPRWVGNLIDPDSYPSVARSLGGDGKVVVLARIDAEGKVQEAKLCKSSTYDVLDQFAVNKVRDGIFTPAFNAQGSPVPCEVLLPIIFQLVS